MEDLGSFFDGFVNGAAEVTILTTFSLLIFFTKIKNKLTNLCHSFLAKPDIHWPKSAWHHPKSDTNGTWTKTIHARCWGIQVVVPGLPTSVPAKHWVKHIWNYSKKYQLWILSRDVSDNSVFLFVILTRSALEIENVSYIFLVSQWILIVFAVSRGATTFSLISPWGRPNRFWSSQWTILRDVPSQVTDHIILVYYHIG